jgi:uncharacterized protein YigE (DUF2233 family)
MACLTIALHKMSSKISIIFYSLALFLCSNSAFSINDWQSLAPGIAYRDLMGGYLSPWSHVHVFRISLKKNTFTSVMATDFSKKLASVQELSLKTGALLAINGGFFDNQYRPLGLRITNYAKINSLKAISWWGVFFIKNKKPYIQSFSEFSPSNNIEFAIQSGPRLLVQGETMPLKPGIAERTALGITKNKQVIILITENAAMTTAELAKLMKSDPLSCTDALNLDGGSSTQLYAAIGKFHRQIHGFSYVSDAVVVKSRS